jgi:hypothetical protein
VCESQCSNGCRRNERCENRLIRWWEGKKRISALQAERRVREIWWSRQLSGDEVYSTIACTVASSPEDEILGSSAEVNEVSR